MAKLKIFITMDGDVNRIMEFHTTGVGPSVPYGGNFVGPMRTENGIPYGNWEREANDANIFSEIMRACPLKGFHGTPLPQPLAWTRISEKDIPADRAYRDAWMHDGAAVVHDMVKAREIHLEHIRQARVEALGVLDRDWMKATGQKDAAAADAVESKRQALRDAPAAMNVDAAKTVADLKLLWPADLPVPHHLAAAGIKAPDAPA